MEILITGGASGLGFALTEKIAQALPNSKIYFTYSNSKNNSDILTSKYPKTFGVKCDFGADDEVDNLCSFLKDRNIDIIINNALAKLERNYFHKTSEEFIMQSFNLNILPVLKITQAFIIKARKRKSGKIITILSSAITNLPPIGMSVYVAEKNYLLSMHKSWASENAAFNMTSNCISPGFMNTNLNSNTDSRIVDEMTSSHPLKKLLTVEEVADTVLFLVQATPQLNMQNIIINSSF